MRSKGQVAEELMRAAAGAGILIAFGMGAGDVAASVGRGGKRLGALPGRCGSGRANIGVIPGHQNGLSVQNENDNSFNILENFVRVN